MIDEDVNFLEDIDPDSNFFSAINPSLHSEMQSTYYSADNYNALYENGTPHLTLVNFNIRSFFANIDMFLGYMNNLTSTPEIIVLSESWLNKDNEPNCTIEGFIGHHTVRDYRRAGGVSVFVDCKLKSHKIVDDNISVCNDNCETCVVNVKYGREIFTIIAVYRPPSGDPIYFSDFIQNLLNSSKIRNSKIILTGDLNLNLLNLNCNTVMNFMTQLQSYHFWPVITKPTRFASGMLQHDPSLLDHIWYNQLDILGCGIFLCDITDHCPVFIKIHAERQPTSQVRVQFRSHDAVSFDLFHGSIRSLTWEHLYSIQDVNEQCQYFISRINDVYCRSFPLKVKSLSVERFKKPWLTPNILKCIKTKALYFKQYKLGLISSSVNNSYKNKVTAMIRRAKRNHFKKCFTDSVGDTRKTWNTIKNVLNNKCSKKELTRILNVDDVNLTDDRNIAQSFCEFFTSIGSELDTLIPTVDREADSYLQGNFTNSFYIEPVTELECVCTIAGLKNTKSGTNEIPASILKSIKHDIAAPLAFIINKSFLSGIFPDQLKKATIVPIHKAGDVADRSNYRPISLLPLFSKLFEKCMSKRLYDYIEKHNIISCKQFGFQRKCSTLQPLIKFTEHVYEAINNKKHVLSLFIDFKKAFDTVNHRILLRKLSFYGIRGAALEWFSSFLRGRQQRVRVRSSLSEYMSVSVGVPQGSILGPILFLFYVNDLPSVSTTYETLLFADDTTFIFSSDNINNLIFDVNRELESIRVWTCCNRLSLNASKTHPMIISTRPTPHLHDLQVTFSNIDLTFVQSVVFLGVRIDSNLRFNLHIDHVCRKISKTVGIMYKLQALAPQHILIKLYYSLVYPYLIYGNVLWGAVSACHMQRLVILQKRIIRIITSEPPLSHTKPLFAQTNILNIKDLHKYLLALYLFRYCRECFIYPNHSHNTRHRSQAVPVFCRLNFSQRSLSYIGPTLWNYLPHSIVTCDRFVTFKRLLKHYFIAQYT